MNILFLTDNFPPEVTAAANRVYERALYWSKWGHKVTILTSAPNFPEGKIYTGYRNKWLQKEYMHGIEIIRVKTFMAPNSGFILRLFDFLSYMFMAILVGIWQRKPDVVISTSPQFFTAVAGWTLSVIKFRPFIFELGDLWPASIRELLKKPNSKLLDIFEKMELFLYRRASAIVALTNAFKENLISRNISANKIFVSRNGVEPGFFTPQAKNTSLLSQLAINNNFIVGYIGTLGMAHGLENILYAANILKNESIHFLIVGSGADLTNLKLLAKKLNLTNITFVPQQPRNEIKQYFSICDISLVHLKNKTVFKTVIPSKIFDAMGMGLPILFVGPTGETSEIIENNNVGICIEPENPEILAKAIIELSKDKIKLKIYSDAGQIAAKIFTRENQAKEMLQVIETVIS